MLLNISIRSMIAATGAVAAMAFAPGAYADVGTTPCTNEGSATVCEKPGNANVFATPPEGSSGGGSAGAGGGGVSGGGSGQNGPYGPAGSQPPVGGH